MCSIQVTVTEQQVGGGGATGPPNIQQTVRLICNESPKTTTKYSNVQEIVEF